MVLCRPLIRCLKVMLLAFALAASTILFITLKGLENVQHTERKATQRLLITHAIQPTKPKVFCAAKKEIVFLKVHKCASSAIGTLLVLFGLKHKLNFALPRFDNGHLGWPVPLRPEHLATHVAKPINIMTHHMVYNKTTLSNLMSNETVYLAILREPYYQFKSAFNFFLVTTQLDMTSKNPMTEFLENPRKFEKPVHFIYNGKYFGAKSITRNFMLTDLGFDGKYSDDEAKIQQHLQYVEDNFHLVMIKEYLLESLVLLRRLLCWDMRDVICRYVNRNRKYRFTVDKHEERHMQLYKEWSKGDHFLYDHFNRTLWKKISKEGPDFGREVDYFESVLHRVDQFCQFVTDDKNITKEEGKKKWTMYLHIQASNWNEPFTLTKMDCIRMSAQPWQFTKSLRKHMKWKDDVYNKQMKAAAQGNDRDGEGDAGKVGESIHADDHNKADSEHGGDSNMDRDEIEEHVDPNVDEDDKAGNAELDEDNSNEDK